MDQQNNTAALNDFAGVLPMDTGATVNGIHDEGEHHPSSANAGAKKGRGRPPKSAGSTKASSNSSDTPKRARGRPPKIGETPSPMKKVVVAAAAVPAKKKEEAATNGDASKKKRGRPSKGITSNKPSNVISKPQVQSTPVINHQEQDNVDEPTKKKRGRPSGTTPKKVAVVASSTSKEASPTKKRGRPSKSAAGKKSAVKPKAPAAADSSAKKRGRPKKSAESPTETAVATTLANETTAVTPNNVQ
jgi:hypothetical protein